MDWPRLQPLSVERSEQLVGDSARRHLLEQIMNAATRAEIDAARQAQRAWLVSNPDDFGVLEAGEDLAHAEEALIDAGRSPAGARQIEDIAAAPSPDRTTV